MPISYFLNFVFILFSVGHNYTDGRWKNPDPHPYKIITDPDPGGLKTYGSGTLTKKKDELAQLTNTIIIFIFS
jgi:hypothetical protein